MTRRLPLVARRQDLEQTGETKSRTKPPENPVPNLPLRAVRRLARPTARVVHRFARAGLPLVIPNGLDGQSAVGLWTHDYLLSSAPNVLGHTYELSGGSVRIDDRTGFRVRSLNLGAYLNGDARAAYFRARLDAFPARLRGDLSTPEYCQGRLRLRSNVWVSPRDTVTHLHFDLPHNLIGQVSGSKQFILYPAREYRNLYPFPIWSSAPHLSRVDIQRPDFRAFPRLPLASGWYCRLEEGDLLLVPSRMWHHALALGDSVTVNHWWPSYPVLPLAVASDLYKRIRSLNI